MSELEILFGAFENFKEKSVLDISVSVDAFAGDHQTINCRSSFSKDNESGIMKLKCNSKIDTEDIKCLHTIDNETNLKSLCGKLGKYKSKEFDILALFADLVDLSVLLSLLNSMEITTEDDKTLISINLKDVATELAEDGFDCFNEDANSHLVTIFKVILTDIASDRYESIILEGHIDNNELNKITVTGVGENKLDVLVTSK